MGLARLPGTHGSEADGRESHGTAAAGRRGFRHVSQQEAGRLPALSRCGLASPPSVFFVSVARAEPRNPLLDATRFANRSLSSNFQLRRPLFDPPLHFSIASLALHAW